MMFYGCLHSRINIQLPSLPNPSTSTDKLFFFFKSKLQQNKALVEDEMDNKWCTLHNLYQIIYFIYFCTKLTKRLLNHCSSVSYFVVPFNVIYLFVYHRERICNALKITQIGKQTAPYRPTRLKMVRKHTFISILQPQVPDTIS